MAFGVHLSILFPGKADFFVLHSRSSSALVGETAESWLFFRLRWNTSKILHDVCMSYTLQDTCKPRGPGYGRMGIAQPDSGLH